MLLPSVSALADKASSFLERANAWAEANPQLAKGAAIAAGVLAALFLVLGGGAIAIAGILAPFAALTFVAGAFNIAMLPMIGIVAAVVAGIALLAAAAYLIYANWGGITAWFSGLWASITGFVSSGIGNIAAAILNWSPIGLFYSAFAGVLSWFGVALPARFTDFGRMLVNGLINGITGMFGKLKSTVVGAASSAAAWFKQKLGIHSPSRVFMGFGGFMMEGLTNGIAAGEAGPIGRLDKLSRRITGAVSTGMVPERGRRSRSRDRRPRARRPAATQPGADARARPRGYLPRTTGRYLRLPAGNRRGGVAGRGGLAQPVERSRLCDRHQVRTRKLKGPSFTL
jgi:hypothetical protein